MVVNISRRKNFLTNVTNESSRINRAYNVLLKGLIENELRQYVMNVKDIECSIYNHLSTELLVIC